MRVLITNLYLAHFSGSEVVVELLADGLRRAGHVPMMLAPTLGAQAARMRERGHIVVDRVAAVPETPDIIHAQHVPIALAALAAFPDTPAVFACHSAFFEVEAPRLHPQIRRWIAVDELCRQRCVSRGVPEERLSVILNAVDLERFARRAPLPPRPQRALLLTKNTAHRDIVHAACAAEGLALDELGHGVGRVSEQVERELPAYDVVFATARMALEAAAVGCAVIVCDGRGFAGLLTSDNLDRWRKFNFGAGLLSRPATVDAVREALAAYDSSDADIVTTRLRAAAPMDAWVREHLAMYERAIADAPLGDSRAYAAATAAWIEDLVPTAGDRAWSLMAKEIFSVEAEPLASQMEQMASQLTQTADRLEHRIGARVQAELIAQRTQAPLRRLWRRLTPAFIRKPLFQLRQWVQGRSGA